jgi:uncharacterized protein involved in copper resistance
MRIGRTILALLIALSVAMLPAEAGAGSRSSGPADMSGSDMSATDMPYSDMSATDMAAMDMTAMDMSAMEGDCCPHKNNPCDNDCTMATCALKCFSFAGTAWSTIAFPSSFAKLAVPFGGGPLSSQTGSPPFRPPRA